MKGKGGSMEREEGIGKGNHERGSVNERRKG